MSRRQEVAAGLEQVRRRIDSACERAGRVPGAVGLVVVTKTFPVGDLRLLADLGVRDVGENKHQEAVDKHAACADLGLRWHFVGGLQSNKAAAVARYADVVHSIDRPKLVRALGKGAREADRQVGCLVQVRLEEQGASVEQGPSEERHGAEPEQAPALADQVADEAGLHLLGVMGVAPLGGDPGKAFTLLAETARRIQAVHPAADMVSAGMSGDLEAAIECGATHVRVGSAVLGARRSLR